MGFFDKIKQQVNNEIGGAANGELSGGQKKTETIRFDDITETLEQFKALPQAEMKTPFDTAAMTVVALCVYVLDKNTGIEMLNFLKGQSLLLCMRFLS